MTRTFAFRCLWLWLLAAFVVSGCAKKEQTANEPTAKVDPPAVVLAPATPEQPAPPTPEKLPPGVVAPPSTSPVKPASGPFAIPVGAPPISREAKAGQSLALEWRALLGPSNRWTNSLAFTPDGQRVLTGAWGKLKVWNLRTGELEQEFTIQDDRAVRILALSRDGTSLATTGSRTEILLWNLVTGTRTSWKTEDEVRGAAFTADGKTLYSLHREDVRRWNVADGKQTGKSGAVADVFFDGAIAVTPDGKTVAVEGKKTEVVLLDGETLKESKRLPGHKDKVLTITLSPDGKTLATTGREDRVLRLWDITTGTELGTLKCDSDRVSGVAFSPSGQFLAVGDRGISVWDVVSRKQLASTPGLRGGATGLAFSPDGTMLAGAGGMDTGVSLWNLTPTLAHRTVEKPKNSWLTAVAPGAAMCLLKPDGRPNDSVDLLNLTTGKVERTLPGKMPAGAAFSPDGKLLVRTAEDYQLQFVDTATGDIKRSMKLDFNSPGLIVFRPDGKRMMISATLGYQVWDLEPNEPKQLFEVEFPPGQGIGAFAFSPDGKTLAIGSGCSIVVADAETGKAKWSAPAHEWSLGTVAFSPDGTRILTAASTDDRAVRVWDTMTGKVLAVLRHDAHAPGVDPREKLPKVWYAFFGPDPGTVVTCTIDGNFGGHRFHLWDVASATRIGSRKGFEDDRRAEFAPDRKTFVTASETTLRVWELAAFERKAFAPTGEAIRDPYEVPLANAFTPVRQTLPLKNSHSQFVAYSADGSRLVAVDSEYTAVVWDTKTGKTLHHLSVRFQDTPQGLALAPDGKRLVVTLYDKTSRVIDLETGKEVLKLTGHRDFVRCAAYSPDGKWIATGRNGSELFLWNAQTGEKVRELKRDAGFIDSIAFSPDSKWLVHSTNSGIAYVFEVETGTERASLKHPSSISVIAVSRDGRLIALGGDTIGGMPKNDVTVWDAHTGKRVYTLRDHPWAVRDLAFGPDGLLAVATSGTLDGYTYLWDTNTGKLVARLPFGDHHAISPDGKTLAMFKYQRVDLIDLTIARDRRVHSALAPLLALGGTVALEGDLIRVRFSVSGPDSIAALESLATFPVPLALELEARETLPDVAVRSVANCKMLRSLTIRSEALTNEHLKLIAGLTGLEEIDLAHCGNLTPDGLAVLAKLDKLTRLAFPKANGDVLSRLAALPNLRALDLSTASADSEALGALAKFPKLEELKLGFAEKSERYAKLADLKSLRRLNLDSSGIEPAAFVHLKGITQLEELILSQTGTDDSALAHLAGLVNLRKLDLSHTRVTDAGFVHLAKLTKLTSLRVNGLEKFTGTGFAHLRGATGMTELNLKFTSVTDAGLSGLKDWKHLRELVLPDTITDAGLAHLGKLAELRVLSLEDAKGITDAGLLHLKGLSKLEELNLTGTKITDTGLPHLEEIPALRYVRVVFTPVTTKAAQALQKRLPKLVIDR